jgi:hypothetical protein
MSDIELNPTPATKLLVENYAAHKGVCVWNTGGGCEALQKDIDNDSGVYGLITDDGGDVPWHLDECDCMLGLYHGDGDPVAILMVGTAQECIDMLGRMR